MNTRPLLSPDAELDLGGLVEPTRTSLLAILSLVAAIICVPPLGLVAVLLAVFALIGIGKSEGKVGGKGIAIAGLVIGLLVSLIQVAIGIGIFQANAAVESGLLAPTADVMQGIESGDLQAVRAGLIPASSSVLTEEHVASFRDFYQSEYGSFKSTPQGMLEWIMAAAEMGEKMNQAQSGAQNIVPLVVEFDSGNAILILEMSTAGGGGGTTGSMAPIRNFGVIDSNGQWVWLIPPDALTAAAQPAAPDDTDDTQAQGDSEGGG